MVLPSKNLLDMFIEVANAFPHQVAIELDQQMWTYSELLANVNRVARSLHIDMGEIVYQYVDRSLEMVCGILSIMCIGGVYCPLNPADSPMRIRSLIDELGGRLVLVHRGTRDKFPSIDNHQVQLVDLEEIFSTNIIVDVSVEEIYLTNKTPCLIVCTSGTTGRQKAIMHTCKSLTASVQAHICWDTKHGGKFLQIASCSWILHLLEIFSALVVTPAGTLVLLRSNDNFNTDEFCTTIKEKQITIIIIGSSRIKALLDYFDLIPNKKCNEILAQVRILMMTGESCKPHYLAKFKSFSSRMRIIMSYGMSEAPAVVGCDLEESIDELANLNVLPIGYPNPGYQCLLVHEQNGRVIPSSSVDEIGEIYVAGAGLFQCYYNNPELTHKKRVTIENQQYFKTGDLARYNARAQLVHAGRTDFQIKIRGQRVESIDVETAIMAWSPNEISNCLVVKFPGVEDLFVAYIISNNSMLDTESIRDYCKERLSQYMIPSYFVVLAEFPLNTNGKVDRQRLPRVDLALLHRKEFIAPSTPLEEQLQAIFAQAFHLPPELVDITSSYDRLGGTSLGAMRALSLIQQRVYNKIDINTLFANPTVQQLAKTIESRLLLPQPNESSPQLDEFDPSTYPKPSLLIEILSILLLVFQSLLPVYIGYKWIPSLIPLFVFAFHLIAYVVWHSFLGVFFELGQRQQLFSSSYYRWWFLSRMWALNRLIWLHSLVGTSLYNSYLRACGARIGDNAYIRTTLIDAPWLIEIGDRTFIADDVYLNNISYQSHTFELHPIKIGVSCSIGTRSVLYEGVQVQDGSLIESYSAIKGVVIGSHIQSPHRSQSNTLGFMFQLLCILAVLSCYILSWKLAYTAYLPMFPLFVSFPICWLVWCSTLAMIALLALKFVVGRIDPGTYSIHSWSYLRHLWLRQLIISSFCYPLAMFINGCRGISLSVLSWLGTHIEDNDIKLTRATELLYFPSNLLSISEGVTTFRAIQLVPYDVDTSGQCIVDCIKLERGVTLANWCSVHPGSHLPDNAFVGALTQVTRETEYSRENNASILLGFPARPIPFVLPALTVTRSDQSRNKFGTLLEFLLVEMMAKGLFALIASAIYWSARNNLFMSVLALVFVYSTIVCTINRCHKQEPGVYSFQIARGKQWTFIRTVVNDWSSILDPFLGGSQWIVYWMRGLGARIIGDDVLLSEINNVIDPTLITIGEHVRMSVLAMIQGHTFEQRLLKLAPTTAGSGCIMKTHSIIFPGAILDGNNVIEPLTLIMKYQHLNKDTMWMGNPAQQLSRHA